MIRDSKKRPFSMLAEVILLSMVLTGCGSIKEDKALTDTVEDVQEESPATDKSIADNAESAAQTSENAEIEAKNAQIDFAALKEKNPDIFAWIYIPDTRIDYPVLQSEEADDYYEYHNADGQKDSSGAVYIELANLTSMCDFNTVLHGKTEPDESGLFAELYNFANPDFFDEHEELYLYLDGNVLTYEIFAAFERENTSLIRSYDFTYISGCQQFLDDMYGAREMNKNLREGWDDLTPYHFLITLTTQKEDNAEKQFVVVAALIEDAAGTIDRVVTE